MQATAHHSHFKDLPSPLHKTNYSRMDVTQSSSHRASDSLALRSFGHVLNIFKIWTNKHQYTIKET